MPATAARPQSAPAVPGELIVGFERGVAAPRPERRRRPGRCARARPASRRSVRSSCASRRTSPTRPTKLPARPSRACATSSRTTSSARSRRRRTIPSFAPALGPVTTPARPAAPPTPTSTRPRRGTSRPASSDVVVGVTDTGRRLLPPRPRAAAVGERRRELRLHRPDRRVRRPSDGVDDDGNGYVDDWRGWDFVNDDNDPFDDNQPRHARRRHDRRGRRQRRRRRRRELEREDHGAQVPERGRLRHDRRRRRRDAVRGRPGRARLQQLVGRRPRSTSRCSTRSSTAPPGTCCSSRPPGTTDSSNDTTPIYPANYALRGDRLGRGDRPQRRAGVLLELRRVTTRRPRRARREHPLDDAGQHVPARSAAPRWRRRTSAGVAALLAARFPDASLYGLKTLLLRSVDPIALARRADDDRVARLNAFDAVSCDDAPKVWLGLAVAELRRRCR